MDNKSILIMKEFWGLTLDEHVSVVKDGYLKHKDSF